jgi:hypothetical protein
LLLIPIVSLFRDFVLRLSPFRDTENPRSERRITLLRSGKVVDSGRAGVETGK